MMNDIPYKVFLFGTLWNFNLYTYLMQAFSQFDTKTPEWDNIVAMKKKYWSGRVTKESNALDLEASVFTLNDPKKIAQSLKRSALASTRRKAHPFQSAMSMLNFYINRAGKNLPANRLRVLNKAKDELRRLFKRD